MNIRFAIQATLIIALIFQVQGKLLQVIELVRHGARGPLGKFYDSEAQKEIEGELVASGLRQHYNLGQQLREEYNDFLPQPYNSSEIYVLSTDLNRTLQSAAAQLQGMFPSGTGYSMPSNLSIEYTLPYFKNAKSYLDSQYALPNNMQIIPVHSSQLDNDLLLRSVQMCNNYQKIKTDFYGEKSETIKLIMSQFKTTFDEYASKCNQTIHNLEQFRQLNNNLESNRYNARYVPTFSEESMENATFISSLAWSMNNDQKDLIRALNTPLMQFVQKYQSTVVSNPEKNKLKWVMLSASDFNIHQISVGLNFTSLDCLLAQRFQEFQKEGKVFYNCEQFSRFSSSVIIELHQADTQISDNQVTINSGKFFIKVRRDGDFMKLCLKNSTICEFEEFNQRLNWFQTDFYSVCGRDDSEQQQDDEDKSTVSGLLIFIIFTQQLIMIGGGYYFYKKRRGSGNFSQFQNEQQNSNELMFVQSRNNEI